MFLAPMLLSLRFPILTPHVSMLHDQAFHALTAETIDVMTAETAGGMIDEMIDERVAMMRQVTTAEAGRTSTETETVVGLETINGCIATTCTLALVAVVSGD